MIHYLNPYQFQLHLSSNPKGNIDIILSIDCHGNNHNFALVAYEQQIYIWDLF